MNSKCNTIYQPENTRQFESVQSKSKIQTLTLKWYHCCELNANFCENALEPARQDDTAWLIQVNIIHGNSI